MINEISRRLSVRQDAGVTDDGGISKQLNTRARTIDPQMKHVLVTVIRDCERLRGMTSEVRETGLASQLEALIHHAGARLFARQLDIESASPDEPGGRPRAGRTTRRPSPGEGV